MTRIPFSNPEPLVEPMKRPEIRNVEDFWCWLNTWGDLEKHDYTLAERKVYRRCISDAMVALEKAGVTFDTVPDETWSRWTGY